jgi:hypothetical protein
MACSKVILRELNPGKGFPYDRRPPRLDRLAINLANEHCGFDYVTEVMNTYHRPSPELDTLIDNLNKYGVRAAPRIKDDAVYQKVLESIERELIPSEDHPLTPLTMGAVAQRPDFPRTKSPGLPYITDRTARNKEEAYQKDKAWIHRTWDMIGRGTNVPLPDAAAFQRLTLSPEGKNKIRPVWGFPVTVVLEEGRFFYPLIEWMKSRTDDHPFALGLEPGRGGMAYINECIQKTGARRYMMIDWSSFDTTIPAWIIRDAFGILAKAFNFDEVTDSEGRVWHVNETKSLRRWNRIIDYFINTVIRFPDGSRFQKDHGVPSGSMFTNIIDTIVNAIVIRYVSYHCTGSFPAHDIYMGDDSLVFQFNGHLNLADWAKFALDTFGMILSVDKSYTTMCQANIQFTGYLNDNGIPVRNSQFLVGSFIYPERTVRNPIETISRAVGQMYASLDPMKANTWAKIVQSAMQYADVSKQEVEDYIHARPGQFKYLMVLGFDTSTITVPQYDPSRLVGIPEVCPATSATRHYGKRFLPWDYRPNG